MWVCCADTAASVQALADDLASGRKGRQFTSLPMDYQLTLESMDALLEMMPKLIDDR